MSDIYYIIPVIIVVTFSIALIKMITDMVKSASALKKAKENGEDLIRCIDSAYKLKSNIISLVFIVFIIFSIILRLFFVKTKLSVYTSVTHIYLIYGSALIFSIFILVLQIITLFKGKYGYLTCEGMILLMRFHKFTNNKFVWESAGSSDKPSNTLHIYQPKKNIPITVVFEEQAQKAHEIVSTNQVNY